MKIVLKKDAPLKPYEKQWQFSIGSCHAPMAHRVDYLRQLKMVHDELGIERVRFHGIFNDDMKVGMTLRNIVPLPAAKKYKQFSFYQIARVYDNLLEIGVRPFVELGFMPKILASGKRKCFFEYKGNVTMPKSIEEWSDFITQFINFLIDRYGREEIAQWYFEVWNEPNLIAFFSGSKKDYFRLYEATARAIKNIEPRIKVGGPATANCAWIEEFVSFVKDNDIPCDFISTHQYAGDPLGHVIKVGAMARALHKRLSNLRKHSGGVLEGTRMIFVDDSEKITDRDMLINCAKNVKRQAGDIPVYYTEWGVSATCTAPINDTRRAASYAIRVLLATEGIIDKTSWWCFSDIFEELQFYTEPFSGSFGLVDIYGIPKPSFYGYKLLSMLGDSKYELENSQNTPVEWAAFKKGEMTQLLLYKQNFDPSNGVLDNISIEIECGVEPKSVWIYRIDEQHCNPLKLWEEMGKPDYLKPSEVEKIKEASALKKEPLDFEYRDGKVVLATGLYNNDVQLIEVE